MTDQSNCGCKHFCPYHGRDEIEVGDDGAEFCNECALDGGSDDLCWPSPGGYNLSHPGANEFEGSFMCPEHAAEHKKFCDEVESDER